MVIVFLNFFVVDVAVKKQWLHHMKGDHKSQNLQVWKGFFSNLVEEQKSWLSASHVSPAL